MERATPRRIGAIEVGFRLVRVLEAADGPLPLKDLSERAGMPPSKAYAYVASFVHEGLIEQDSVTGRYGLGPFAMIAQHYDLVLNGFELGSGSIRIHDADFQQRIFEVFGLSASEIEDRFGFFTKALRYGAPPHGGMAWGIDRLAMLACGETSIREVIAFPKNQVWRDLMMEAPSSVAPAQLNELGIALKGAPEKPSGSGS